MVQEAAAQILLTHGPQEHLPAVNSGYLHQHHTCCRSSSGRTLLQPARPESPAGFIKSRCSYTCDMHVVHHVGATAAGQNAAKLRRAMLELAADLPPAAPLQLLKLLLEMLTLLLRPTATCLIVLLKPCLGFERFCMTHCSTICQFGISHSQQNTLGAVHWKL